MEPPAARNRQEQRDSLLRTARLLRPVLDRFLCRTARRALRDRPFRYRRRAMRHNLSKERMTPAATIIIPLKRQQDAWLEQCVLSAVGQSASCETLVVRAADAPSSNLALLERLTKEWESLSVIVEEQLGSFPAAINLGIRWARAERIGLLLSDDWLDREAVAHCLPIDADIVCTRHTVYHADGVTVLQGASKTLTMRDYLNLPTLEAKARYLDHFFLFRRAALSEAGGLNETIGNFPGIDDYDLI